MSSAELDGITPDDVLAAAKIFDQRPGVAAGLRVALYAPSAWGLAEQLAAEVRDDGATVIVFNSLSVACAYLGVDLEVATTYIRELRTVLRTT